MVYFVFIIMNRRDGEYVVRRSKVNIFWRILINMRTKICSGICTSDAEITFDVLDDEESLIIKDKVNE